MLYNAAMRPFGRLMETKASTFENTWRVNAMGAFLCSQQVVPAMLKAGSGVILFTGATAGVKPFATSAAFGPAKFAMRGLAQVMARDLGPQGVHVAYVNVDGPIDMPFIRQLRPQAKEEDLLKPSAIAETYWHVAHQDRSAWTQEIDVRPFKEQFSVVGGNYRTRVAMRMGFRALFEGSRGYGIIRLRRRHRLGRRANLTGKSPD